VSHEDVAREASLTWGQRWVWTDQYRRRGGHAFAATQEIIDVIYDLSPDDAESVLRALVDRHEALRTRVELRPDGDPVQIVDPPGECVLDVLDLLSGGPDLAELTESFLMSVSDFDAMVRPYRAAAVVSHGRVLRLLLSVHHVAVDHWGIGLVRAEVIQLIGLVGQGRPPVLEPASSQPREQAAWQATHAGRRQHDDSVAAWESELARMPQTLFPETTAAREDLGTHVVRLRSKAAALACAMLARRHGMPPGVVNAAVFALLLAGGTGFCQVPMELISSNRYRPEQAGMVGSETAPALLVLDVDPDLSLRQFMADAARAGLSALRRSYCDQTECMAVALRAGHRRGMYLYPWPEFNNLVAGTQQPGGLEADVSQIRAAVAESQVEVACLSWFDRLRLTVLTNGDRAEVELVVPERNLAADRVVSLAQGFEALMVAAAECSDSAILPLAGLWAAAGLTAPPRNPGWVRVDGSLVRLPALAELLRSHPGIASCGVFTTGPSADPTIRAYVVPRPDEERVTPEGLHRWLVARLRDHRDAMAAHEYVISAHPPARHDDARAWADVPVLARGAGRRPPAAVTTATAEERALLQSVDRYGAAGTAIGDVYVVSGGNVGRIPAVLTALWTAGYGGLDFDDLNSPATLRELATKLYPVAPASTPLWAYPPPVQEPARSSAPSHEAVGDDEAGDAPQAEHDERSTVDPRGRHAE
jgi:hypothetical protein